MPRLLFNRWAKSSSFTPSEFQVLEKLIPQNSTNATKLLNQARQSPYVVRTTTGHSGYQARIPYLEDDSLLVEADHDIASPSVEVVESRSGRRLRFSTVITRGGFLFGLKGMVADGGKWPRSWEVGAEIAQPKEALTWLQELISPMDALDTSPVWKMLIDWSGAEPKRIPESQKVAIRFARPSTNDQIADCEARLETRLPEQYIQLVKITNGFGIQRGRPYEILGTSDISYLDELGNWIGITPLYEDGYVALANGDESANCYLLLPNRGATRIGDLRQHVRESLEWKEE